ncbi:MAG: response regulator [Spirochaetales bacterium]|nr:response regulator [Spirochaetales bacterium]
MIVLLPFISIFVCIIYIHFGFYAIKKNKNDPLYRLFFLVAIICTYWSLCITVFYLVKNKIIAKNIYLMSLVGPIILPAIVIHYILTFTKRTSVQKKRILIGLLYLPSLINIIGLFIPDTSIRDLVSSPFGWIIEINRTSPFVWFYISYNLIYSGIIIFLLSRWKDTLKIRERKKQATLIIVFLLLSILFVVVEEIVSRFLMIHPFPPVSNITAIIWLVGILFIIKRNKYMRISPEKAVHEILFNMMDILILTGEKGEIIQINQQLTHLLGFTEKELSGKSANILFTEELNLSDIQILTQSRKIIKTKQENTIPVILRIEPIKNNDQDIFGYLLIGHDAREREKLEQEIIERENAEKRLIESRSLHISTINALDEIIHVVDTDLRIILCNETFYNVAKGFKKNIILGETKLDEVFPFLKDEVLMEYREVFTTGKPILSEEQNEIGGGTFYTEVRKIPVMKNHRISFVVTIIRDVTDKKKIDQTQLQSGIVDSVSLLASGIAHDYNNLLTTILGNISLAKNYFSHRLLHNEALSGAETAVLRARELTQQLLTFSQKGTLVKQTGDIGKLLKKSASFFLSGSNIKCDISISDNLYKTSFDKQQIARVFQNLLLNAKQAMPGGGALSIRTRNRIIEEESGVFLPPGKYIEISFIDQGEGMSDEILPRIFNPYFTTKESGSGLGLATAYSIVKKHGGTIEVTSKIGEGSTFSVCLPADESIEEVEVEIKRNRDIKKGKGTILLMDDDRDVRDTLKRILEHMGYDVKDAENGNQVISLYTSALKSGRRFDLVILDLTIQGGENGGQVFQNLREYDPLIKAVIISGYGANENFSNLHQMGLKGFIKKPFDVVELSELLEKIIASSG